MSACAGSLHYTTLHDSMMLLSSKLAYVALATERPYVFLSAFVTTVDLNLDGQ